MKRIPQPKSIRTPKLVGEAEQAPGLKTRDGDILHKALGMTGQTPIHPIKLAVLADSHPNAKVRTAAKSALSKLSFKLNPLGEP